MTKGIRGAITVEANTEAAIKAATVELLNEMIAQNNLTQEKISHVIFTVTTDLNAAFPAKFATKKIQKDVNHCTLSAMQSEPSSVSSSDVLRSHLSSVHSIANATPTEVAASFQAKVQENLMLKEQIIQLQNSLKVVKESMELQAAEFAFQRSEYEYELESAKTIEAELRSALLKASQGKAEIMRDVEEKYRKQIDAGERQRNEYLQNLQGQVTRMRNKLVEMQGENEAIKDDYEKACQANTDLKNQLDDQHEVYTAKVAMLEKHIEVLQAETSKVIGELRAKTTD